MYGTIARFEAKPGTERQLLDKLSVKIPGLVTIYVYQMDANPNTYYATVMFESKAAYLANANSPEQHMRYKEMLKLLTGEPEWHDGEIVQEVAFGL